MVDSAYELCEEDPEYQYDLWKRTLERIVSGEVFDLSPSEVEAADDFHAAASDVCYGRAFFSTAGGRIGMGPSDVMKGDVCVFYSGGPLYTIRFKDLEGDGEEAELIGEAYVHGLMRQGQAFESPDRGPDENFILVWCVMPLPTRQDGVEEAKVTAAPELKRQDSTSTNYCTE
jgi:hypothetical protein